MPSLRELKKRLKSAGTIEQLSGAMRTASTAKYVKVGSSLTCFSPYAAALKEIGSLVGGATDGQEPREGRLIVLISGNHGLCGGYHQVLFTFFEKNVLRDGDAVVTAGKKAAEFCRAKNIPVVSSFDISDVPAFSEAKELSSLIRAATEGKRCVVVFQRFVNMMKSTPVDEEITPVGKNEGVVENESVIFIPDRATVVHSLNGLVPPSELYEKLLSASAAAQAATAVAMRSAGDNAKKSISSLSGRINRMRQASVTESVLETSAQIKE